MTSFGEVLRGTVRKLVAPLPGGLRQALRTVYEEVEISLAHSRGVQQAHNYDTAVPLYLHLGCGHNYKPGWVNIDLGRKADLKLDLRRSLPFSDGSCEFIYSEHFLEHLDYPQPVTNLLRECLRVLIPGGELSLAVPDGEMVLNAYVLGGSANYYEAEARWHPSWCETRMEHVNYNFRQGGEHRFIYDLETLADLLQRCGFADVQRRAFDPRLDQEERITGSLYVSCCRP